MFYVYVYTDPRTELPFYVGKGSGDRSRAHLTKSHNEGMNRVLSDLKSKGLSPRIDIVFKSEDEDLTYEIEEHLIDSYGVDKNGGLLVNRLIGGKTPSQLKEENYEILKDNSDLLGTMPDSKVSELLGVNRMTVNRYRKSLNILPFRHTDETGKSLKIHNLFNKHTGDVLVGTRYELIAKIRPNTPAPKVFNGIGCEYKAWVNFGIDENIDKSLCVIVTDNSKIVYKFKSKTSDDFFIGTKEEFVEHINLTPKKNVFYMINRPSGGYGWNAEEYEESG